MIGRGDKEDILYLIDFGLAKEYIDPQTEKHIPFSANHGVVGTLRYISVVLNLLIIIFNIVYYLFMNINHISKRVQNIHQEIEATRRDDLISLSYLLVYLFKGSLPWQFPERMSIQERFLKILYGNIYFYYY